MSFEEHFKGKHALVTGAGRGIGRAIAIRLHSYGAQVYALSRTLSTLESLKQECPNINTIHLDLTADWNTTREVVKKLGPLDYVVNNAAVLIPGSFMNIKPEDFDKVFDVDIKAVINVSQVAAQNMIDAGVKGSILNFSSGVSRKPFPPVSTYCLAKATMNMLSKLMAAELGPHGIRVNTILPAGVNSDMLDTFWDAMGKAMGITPDQLSAALSANNPNRRIIMEMDEIVNASLFLLSPLSPMVHGEELNVDGGFQLV